MIKKLLLLILIPFILSGCTNRNIEEITFSTWGSVSEVKILKSIISEFEAENPDIKVRFMHIPQNYFQKIHLLFASNTAPDVVFINNLYLPVYSSFLEDLSSEINPDDFYPQSIEGLSKDGKLLAIPRDISNLVFYVNTDLVHKTPKNLEELVEIARQTTKNGVFGISFEEDVYYALPYLQAFDENILEGNYSNGLEFYKSLRDKYHIAPAKNQVGSSTLAQMFLDEKIGMYLSGRWMYPKIKEKAGFRWKVISFPSEKGVPCDASGWAISKNSKHKTSAIKFVKYLSSKQSSEYFTKTGLIIPAKIESSKLVEEKVFLDVIKTSKPTPVNKDYRKVCDKINSEM